MGGSNGFESSPILCMMTLMKKPILIATGNQGKAKEFQQMLGEEWEVQTLANLENPIDVVEDGETFAENAAKKALAFVDQFDGPILADDSGLEVDSLDGAPGIYSARYAGEAKDDEANNTKLLHALEGISDPERGAQFRCVLALVVEGEVKATFDGVVRGTILRAPRGENGFGYDPLFLPDGSDVTTAEMASDEKHQISHRGKALRQAVDYLQRL